jgi:hypothetical protein
VRCFDALEITGHMSDPGRSSGQTAPARYTSPVNPATRTDTPRRNVYDPRLRELIRATGNPDLFPELDIPRSTALGCFAASSSLRSEPNRSRGQKPNSTPRSPDSRAVSRFSSMVEAWWRGLRHQWLYLNTLDTVAAVRRLAT